MTRLHQVLYVCKLNINDYVTMLLLVGLQFDIVMVVN